ncbi:MAG: cytochrome P450, partial [Firmicutes bacterium]|nr:cytochrome P450 [Bacillota bacterium]
METEFTWNRSAIIASPHTFYSQLRMRTPRLCEIGESGEESWTFTTHEDVSMALKDPRFILEWRSLLTPEEQEATADPVNPVYQMFRQWMLFRDPPDHSRLRGLVSKAFTPRMVEQLRPRVQAIAQAFVDDMRERGSVDLVANYAFLIPITVIAEMLGVPTDDREQFRVWSRAIANALDSGEDSADPQMQNAGRTAIELTHYFRGLVAKRRQEPRADLISAMIAAEEAGDKLTEQELLATLILLLVAGHETTVNLIGNSIILLKHHPQVQQALLNDPSRIPAAVEEFLRYESPVMMTSRFAAQDIQLGDQ